jgi:hypothetical protein
MALKAPVPLAVGGGYIKGGVADEGAVLQAEFPAGHASALNFDFGVVDEVGGFS